MTIKQALICQVVTEFGMTEEAAARYVFIALERLLAQIMSK